MENPFKKKKCQKGILPGSFLCLVSWKTKKEEKQTMNILYRFHVSCSQSIVDLHNKQHSVEFGIMRTSQWDNAQQDCWDLLCLTQIGQNSQSSLSKNKYTHMLKIRNPSSPIQAISRWCIYLTCVWLISSCDVRISVFLQIHELGSFRLSSPWK